jgi:hypothetical protein
MEGIYQHYIIDISSNNNFVQIPTVQGDGDNVRGFEVELIANNIPYIVDAETTYATIIGTKPDESGVWNECVITEDGYLLVDITSQMSAVEGRGNYHIMLVDRNTNRQIKSFPFIIVTTKATFNPSDVISTDEFKILTETISQAQKDYEYVMENAQASANSAKESEENAKLSAEQAKESETNTSISEKNAENYANSTKENAEIATEKATDASEYADMAKSYAIGTDNEIREGDESDNAKYYYDQTKRISEGLNGAFLPMGTVTFEELQNQTKMVGYMYNISNDFVSDDTFKDGARHNYPAGTNVYYTADGYWDCLVGIINGGEIISTTEPLGQAVGNSWLLEY